MRNLPEFDTDEMLEGLGTWVLVESPTDVPEGVNAMMDLAEAEMVSLGAAIRREPGGDGYGDVLVARVGGAVEDKGILVLGHLDTVHGVGTLAGPLPFRRDGDRLYGPGIYDMKGGMYAACYAMKQLLRAGRTPILPVTFMFIPNEEVGSPTTRQRIEDEARRHRFVLVPEPAKQGRLVTGRHGIARYIVTTRGRPSHAGATLARGASAIREMAPSDPCHRDDVRSRFRDHDERRHRQRRHLRQRRSDRMPCRGSGGLSHPRGLRFHCRVHVLPEAGQRGCHDHRGTGPVRPLFEPGAGTLALYSRAEEIAGSIGFVPGHGSFGGGSDGNFTGALGIPTLDGLGLCGDGAHTHDEHILVSSLVPRARLLAGLLESLGGPGTRRSMIG